MSKNTYFGRPETLNYDLTGHCTRETLNLVRCKPTQYVFIQNWATTFDKECNCLDVLSVPIGDNQLASPKKDRQLPVSIMQGVSPSGCCSIGKRIPPICNES